MKHFAQLFATMFSADAVDSESTRRNQIHREWDRARASALTASELAEIDAIFARNL